MFTRDCVAAIARAAAGALLVGLTASALLTRDAQAQQRGTAKAKASARFEEISIEAFNPRGQFVRHQRSEGFVDPVATPLECKDARFKKVPGLADAKGVSFESTNFPGHYLRHRNSRLILTECPELLDKQDATFLILKGLAQERDGWVSLEPLMFSGQVLQVREGELWIGPRKHDADFPKSATFRFAKPVSPKKPIGEAGSRLWYTIQVQVVQCCDDDGGRKCPITANEVQKMIDFANELYAKARVRFAWSAKNNFAVVRNTILNSLMPTDDQAPKGERAPGAGTLETEWREMRRIAEQYRGKMVVLFRWGDNLYHKSARAFSPSMGQCVVMAPQVGEVVPRWLSHEVGHYMGIGHTFVRQFGSVAEAAEFLKNHGGDTSVFDGDRLSDTLPDPGLNIANNNGVRKANLNGKDIPLPTGNVMSYMVWRGHEWMSDQQAERVRAYYRFRSRFGMVYPTNCNAPSSIEAESLSFETHRGLSVHTHEMRDLGIGCWSGDAMLLANGRPGASLTLPIEVKESGPKEASIYMTYGFDYAKVDISIDGKRVGQTFDGYSPQLSASGRISLGRLDLSKGSHIMEFKIVGKNEESDGMLVGIDCVSLVAVKP